MKPVDKTVNVLHDVEYKWYSPRFRIELQDGRFVTEVWRDCTVVEALGIVSYWSRRGYFPIFK